MSDAAPPVVVLVNPQLGQNIGKAARAMLNFGLTEMRLVAPRDGWPNPEAGPAASGADRILDEARVYDSTAEALADINLVYASTVRRRDLHTPVVDPEGMAREMHASAGKAAILFGPERSGLTGEDVNLAQKIVTVPINPDFGSLNLAQAVILLAYEWSRGQGLAQPTVKDASCGTSRARSATSARTSDTSLGNCMKLTASCVAHAFRTVRSGLSSAAATACLPQKRGRFGLSPRLDLRLRAMGD